MTEAFYMVIYDLYKVKLLQLLLLADSHVALLR
jgi:hypothetical protein